MNQILILAIVFGMIFTGTINTILNKFQDMVCIYDCQTNPRYFEQPLLQTFNMFMGEIMCLFVYFMLKKKQPEQGIDEDQVPLISTQPVQVKKLDGWLQLYFLIPAAFDLTATTLMNIGLLFISASIYQMLRGSVVLFTGIFSSIFLNIKHPLYRW